MEPRLNARVGVIAVTLSIGFGAVSCPASEGITLPRIALWNGEGGWCTTRRAIVYFHIISPSANLVTGGAMVHHGRFALPESDPIVPGTSRFGRRARYPHSAGTAGGQHLGAA